MFKCVCFQVVEELDGPSLEWDEEYALSESPPLQELNEDEDELQALKKEEEDLTESTKDQKVQEVFQRAEGEPEATQDSGVETEELQRHSSLSHRTLTDDIIDKESQGENYKVNGKVMVLDVDWSIIVLDLFLVFFFICH